ncbi:MAG: hypothetical protein U1D55_15450 [Phycisphaerae bacterium]
MSAAAVLAQVCRRGIRLVAVGDRLRFAPASAVTPELREALAQNKPELLRLLTDPDDAGRTDWRARLTDAERQLFPPNANPPADWIRDVLAARATVDGELIEITWPALGPLVESPRGYLTPETLPPAWREWYEERAAIREFDGRQPREYAEAEALRETVEAMRREGLA